MRLGQNLVQTHAEALAALLGRPAEQIQERGLNALDFKDTLRLEFIDGSNAVFHGAFFLHDPTNWAVVVFTEHCGYVVFPDVVRILNENGDVLFDGLC